MEHNCIQAKEIEQMKIDLAVAKSDVKQVKTDIKGIKDSISKLNLWLIGIMGTTIVSLIILILKK